ncbi:MAG: hypothetical protein WC455_23815 [Dehalococcoidia bacterium]|jgi:hypothetical protein
MSKKAEELVLNIGQLIAPLPATYKGGEKIVEINVKALQGATALLDDFARKVRELAAQRVRKLAENTMDNIPLIDAIAAILANEED